MRWRNILFHYADEIECIKNLYIIRSIFRLVLLVVLIHSLARVINSCTGRTFHNPESTKPAPRTDANLSP